MQYIREIGRLHPFRMEAPAETLEIGRASAWGNVRLFEELTNGSDSRFDDLRNAPEVRRVLVEDRPASEVSVEEALTAAIKIIKVSRTMTSTLGPIKDAADIEEKTDCAIINRQTGFKWLAEEPESPAMRKLARKKKKGRRRS